MIALEISQWKEGLRVVLILVGLALLGIASVWFFSSVRAGELQASEVVVPSTSAAGKYSLVLDYGSVGGEFTEANVSLNGNGTLIVYSSSASDAKGTNLTIYGWNGTDVNQTVTLSGATCVNTRADANFSRVYAFALNASNVGSITVKTMNSTPTTVATIPVGSAFYHAPLFLNASFGHLPNVNVTTASFSVPEYANLAYYLYVNQSTVAALTFGYEVSPDNVTWVKGSVARVNGNATKLEVGDKGVRFIRAYVNNSNSYDNAKLLNAKLVLIGDN